MADANLFQQYLRPAKSVTEYGAELDNADAQRNQNALTSLTLRSKVAADANSQAANAALRRIAMGWTADTPDERRVADLRNSGLPELMTQADALEKGSLERQKVGAEVGEKKAKTTREQGATIDDAVKRYRGALDFIDTPEGAARWMQAQYADPTLGAHMASMGPIETALQRIPQDPAAFQQWRQRNAVGMDKFMEQQGKAANELIGPDGKPNRPLIDAKKEIAKAGSSSVSVTTDGLGLKPKDRFEMEGKLADDYKQVTKLDNLVLSATSKIKTALSQDGAIKDQAAIYSFAKMLDPEGAVREADYAAIANTTGLLDRVKNYANKLLTGEQLNPTQRQEMITLMQAFEKVANDRIKAAQEDFGGQATRYNLRPESVFSGTSRGATKAADPAKAPAAAPKTLRFDAQGNPLP